MGLNIRKLMKKRRWNYVTLGEEMGVTRQTIAKWDKGVTTPTTDQIVKLAVILNCTVEELLESVGV